MGKTWSSSKMSRMRAEKNADLEMSVGRYWSQIALSNYAILVRNQVVICSSKVKIVINCAARRVGGLTPQICQNIPKIGKLPYGAKRGFIERKALLKERLY